MEHIEVEKTPITFKQRAKNVGEAVLAWMFDPAVVGVVRSSSTSEANVDDHELMQYYANHPETEIYEPLAPQNRA